MIKHGIKASGMPAWGLSMGDEHIWNLVAFQQALPDLSPGEYQAMVANSGGHSHGGGETQPDAHSEVAPAHHQGKAEATGEGVMVHEHADGTAEAHPAKLEPVHTSVPHAASEPPTHPHVVIYMNANCGCCDAWVEHMRDGGFDVEGPNVSNVHAVKERIGLPPGKGSCHTAEVAGYFLEGHVPAADVRRLLLDRPDAQGLVVPGMPMGSPGMEAADGTVDAYAVELVENDGSTTHFAHHGG